jgi:hypothetical protein
MCDGLPTWSCRGHGIATTPVVTIGSAIVRGTTTNVMTIGNAIVRGTTTNAITIGGAIRLAIRRAASHCQTW